MGLVKKLDNSPTLILTNLLRSFIFLWKPINLTFQLFSFLDKVVQKEFKLLIIGLPTTSWVHSN
jgi:hypothetical protein